MCDCMVHYTLYYMLYLTNRFQVAVRLFSNRSQMTSKCGKNKKKWYRRTATWNLFVLYNKELKKSFNDDVIYTSVLQ